MSKFFNSIEKWTIQNEKQKAKRKAANEKREAERIAKAEKLEAELLAAKEEKEKAKHLAYVNRLLKQKHVLSQTPAAIRMREYRRNGKERFHLGESNPEAQRLAAASRLAELLMTQITIPDESIVAKMYEQDEVDKLVKSLHIRYLTRDEKKYEEEEESDL